MQHCPASVFCTRWVTLETEASQEAKDWNAFVVKGVQSSLIFLNVTLSSLDARCFLLVVSHVQNVL